MLTQMILWPLPGPRYIQIVKHLSRHDANPPVQEYVTKHAELADGFTIEIYGNVSQKVIETINRLGVPLKHFKTTRVGYVREKNFKEH